MPVRGEICPFAVKGIEFMEISDRLPIVTGSLFIFVRKG